MVDNEFIGNIRDIALMIKEDNDNELWLNIFINYVYKHYIKPLHNQLKDLDYYKFFNIQYKKKIEYLITELETYRPSKLSGNGQCKCSNCGVVNWTDYFSRYKGQLFCDSCIKEILNKDLVKK